MILVRNHRQLLNGNKSVLMYVILCLVFLSACKTTKSVRSNTTRVQTGNTTTNPNGNSSNEVKLDTIQWTDISPKEPKVTSTDGTRPQGEMKDSYNVTLFIPFNGTEASDNQIMESGFDANRFTNYYAGVKMALAELESKNVNLNVEVVDSETGVFSQKLERSTNADVIIGPSDSDKLKLAVDFGKRKKIPVVSPWRAGTKIGVQNPYYVQLRPNITTYMKALVDHILGSFTNDQVFLLGRENNSSDKKMVDYMQRYASAKDGRSDKPFSEFYIQEDSLLNGETAFDSIFYTGTTSVFILPNYSFSKDEDYVYSCVRKLSSEKDLNDVILCGMPMLLDSERIGFEHYRNLRMRIVRSKYLDRANPQIKNFRRKFYENYGALPTNDAYEGYDMMNYIGMNLAEHGTEFQFNLDGRKSKHLQTTYDVQKVFKKGSDDYKDIQYLENKNLDIIGFESNRFRKL